MKPVVKILLLILTPFLLSCGDDSGDVSPKGAPEWIANSPSVASGAVSADLNASTQGAARVYYVVSIKPLSYSADQIIKYGVKPSNSNIKAHGVIETSAGEESRKTISALTQRTRYYAYFAAQNIKDTIYQQTVSSREFVTASRLDTAEFSSSAENRKVKYVVYRPEEAIKYPDRKYPICYALGGNGEVATADKPINMIRNGSLLEYVYKGNNVPMIVMGIQHDRQNWNVELIDEGITHGNKTYPVDEDRVYLTGMSGGGIGCWNYAVAHPGRLAAIVPISGSGNTGKACNLKGLAVWAFHNQTDNIVGSANSVNMLNAIEACPPQKEAKLLLFPDTGHDCWRRVYDQNHANWSKSPGVAKFDIYAWLLSKKR